MLLDEPGWDRPALPLHGEERDAETGNDHFGARYYAARRGRFTTIDPIRLMPQKLTDPQQWNMYAYVRNNPLRFMDPTGQYICAGGGCADFERARQAVLQSRDADARRGGEAYGAPGEDNGVTVNFMDNLEHDRGGIVHRTSQAVRLDPKDPTHFQALLVVTIRSDRAGNQEIVAHEGSHVADYQAFVRSMTMQGGADQSLNITGRQSEFRAYLTSITYAQRGNLPTRFGPCGMMAECTFPPMMMPAQRAQRINDLLNDPRQRYTGLDEPLYPEPVFTKLK